MLPSSNPPPTPDAKRTAYASGARTQYSDDMASAFGGGYSSYVMWALWMALAFVGIVVQLAGLAALQNYFYKSPHAVAHLTTHAGIAALSPGDALRWNWWALFFVFLVSCVLCAAAASGGVVVRQARGALLAWTSAAVVVNMVSADQLNSLRGSTAGAMKSSARAAFAGAVIDVVALLCAVYHLGVAPMAG